MKKTTIICVLKLGGDFTSIYVRKLQNAVKRHLNMPYEFICLTDDTTIDFCKTIPLKHSWKGWWSKVELFRAGLSDMDRVMYFDLDTIILNNIDILTEQDYDFIALQPFNPKKRSNSYLMNSSIMSWRNHGAFDFLYDQFNKGRDTERFRGDQDYIGAQLIKEGKKFNHWQLLINGIYSYKRNCKKEVPEETKIVCFHGRPRLPKVNIKWVKENWI